MPESLLLAVTVLAATGAPVKGVWIECDQMWKSAYWEEQTTDSHGRFMVIVPPGPHLCSAAKDAAVVQFTLDGQDLTVSVPHETSNRSQISFRISRACRSVKSSISSGCNT